MSEQINQTEAVVDHPADTSKKKSRKSPITPQRRKRNLTIITLIFVIIAVAFLLMYLLVWQHEESTDDSYVNGYVVQITPQIPGTVQQVYVDDTQRVKANQLLVQLDDSDMQMAFERAKSELINAIRQNQQQTAASSQASAQVIVQKTQLARLEADLNRRQSLAGTDAISAEELSHAKEAVNEAKAALISSQAQEKSAKAVIGHNVPLREQPAVLTAVSHVKDAWLNLERTKIYAPMNGQIAKRNVQVGQKVAAGTPLMAVIPLDQVWVDANFKESQLANMRIGQPAKVTADIYGSKVEYDGKVVGLSAGTGSAFSLLPAQNATGNWIKVVQRVPVRIELDKAQLAKYPLHIMGLSMDVEVNTSNQKGHKVTDTTFNHQDNSIAPTNWSIIEKEINQIFAQYGE